MFLITQPQVLLSTFPFMQIRVALTASYNLILLCEGILVSKSPNSLFITSESQVFWNQGAILCYRLILGLLVDRNLKSHQTRTCLVWISLLKHFFFANPTALSLHACQTFWDLLSCSLGLWSCVSSLDFCSHTSITALEMVMSACLSITYPHWAKKQKWMDQMAFILAA